MRMGMHEDEDTPHGIAGDKKPSSIRKHHTPILLQFLSFAYSYLKLCRVTMEVEIPKDVEAQLSRLEVRAGFHISHCLLIVP